MKNVKKSLAIFLVIISLVSIFSISVSAATTYASYGKKYGCVVPVKTDGKTTATSYSVNASESGTFKFSFKSKGYKSNVYFGIAVYSDEKMQNSVMSKYGTFPTSNTVASLNFDFSSLTSATYYAITYTYIKKGSDYVIDSDSIYTFTIKLNKVSGTVPQITGADALYTGNYIAWKAVKFAEYYRVYRKQEGTSWEKLADVTELSYLDTTAIRGEKYYYTVKAFDGACCGSYNKNGAELVYLEAPVFKSEPQKLADNAVYLSWSDVKGAETYRIYRRTAEDTSYTRLATVKGNVTEYTDTSAKNNGTVYYYKVRALNGTVAGLVSSAAKVEIFGMFKLNAACTGEKVTLTWGKVENADSYTVYKKMGTDGEWQPLETVNGDILALTDTEVYGGNTYSYSLVAEKNGQYSSFDTKGVTVICLAEPKISSLSASVEDSILVKWGAVSGAKTYNVYRKSAVDENYTLIGSTSSCSFYDTTQKQNNIIYFYYVEAVNGSHAGMSGNNTSAILFMQAPVMTSVKWSSGNVVKWNRVAGATSYRVYRMAPGGSYKQIAEVSSGVLNYTDKTASKSGKYYYTVAAMNGKVRGSYGQGYGINCLNAPELTSVSVAKSGATTVKWSKVSGASGYYVYRKTPEGSWTRVAKTTALSYTDSSTRVSGTEYIYTVKAYNSSGNGIYDSFGIASVYLSVPSVKTLTTLDNGSNYIKWGAVTGAECYRVYRRTEGGSYKCIAKGVSGVTYTDKTADKNTVYYYTVRAEKNGSLSGYKDYKIN